MAHINSLTGEICYGAAGGPASVDGRLIADPGGDCCWIDEAGRLVAYQTTRGGHAVVETLALNNRLVMRLSDLGAAPLVAGGWRWAGWLAGRGMAGALGLKPDAYPLGAGRDGTLAWTRDYAGGRRGIVLSAPDGREVDIVTPVAQDVQVYGPEACSWIEAGQIRTFGLPLPAVTLPTVWRHRRVVLASGEVWWICDAGDAHGAGVGVVAHPEGSLLGYQVTDPGAGHNHDAVAWQDGIRVAWSATPGEGPADGRHADLDLSAPRIDLRTLGQPIVVDPIKPPKEPVDPLIPHPKEPPVSTAAEWSRWMDVELPQLMQIYAERHGGTVPAAHWGAFQTARRGVIVPEGKWTFAEMFDHEKAEGSAPTTEPPQSAA